MRTLTTVIEANFFELIASWCRSPQSELHNDPKMVRYVTGSQFPLFNGVFRAQFILDEIDERIDQTVAYFKSRGLPWCWITGPSTQPTDLGTHLEAHGLTYWGDAPGMAMDLLALNEDFPTPSSLTIEHISDTKTLKQYIHVYAIGNEYSVAVENARFDSYARLGFGPDNPWRYYIGWLEGEVVACSSLLLWAGLAAIHNVVTIPDARGQGIGTAMTLAPLREARNMGYRIGILHSSPAGLNIYRRIGFQEYCKLGFYGLAA